MRPGSAAGAVRDRAWSAESPEPEIRILMLNTRSQIGAVQSIHARISRLLDKRRFAVFVATAHQTQGALEWDDAPGVTVWTTRFGRSIAGTRGVRARVGALLAVPIFIAGIARTALRVRAEGIDFIHTALTPRDALGGWLLSVCTGARLVIHCHYIYWGEYPLSWRLAFRRAAGILAVSEASKQSLVGIGVPAAKISVLYNGVDLGAYHPRVDGTHVRRELGVPPEDTLLLLPARICPGKGQGVLVQALGLLRRRGIAARAVFVGRDDPWATPGGGSYSAALRQMALSAGVSDSIVFLDHREDMPRLMAASDIVVVPSVDDPYPTVVMEAMATGRPVVASHSGGVPEQLEAERSGVLVAPGSPEALACAIARLMLDPATRRGLGCAARQHAERRHGYMRMARDAEGYYRHLYVSSSVMRSARCGA